MNEALRPKFLDLKEGACVISLKPFVSVVNARVTKRNVLFAITIRLGLDFLYNIFTGRRHQCHF